MCSRAAVDGIFTAPYPARQSGGLHDHPPPHPHPARSRPGKRLGLPAPAPSSSPRPGMSACEFGGMVLRGYRRGGGGRWRPAIRRPGTCRLSDIRMECFMPLPGVGSICEWKGPARLLRHRRPRRRGHAGGVARKAAWAYPRPTPAFAPIVTTSRVYPGLMDGLPRRRRARAPAGGRLLWRLDHAGRGRPFKGGPGTRGW